MNEPQEMMASRSGRETHLDELLRAALAGDDKAYEVFLTSAAKLVRAVLRRKAGPGSVDIEDVVQETLLALHLKRHTWRPEAPVLPWLFTIARYKLIDVYRRKGRRIEVDIAEFSETLAAAADDETVNERDMERVLDILPEGQRRVVESISIDGRSIGETAQALGMKEGAVRVALHRGLKAIAQRFGQS